MGVVFGLADRISVLVYGKVLATGTPEEIRGNPAVHEAYLGAESAKPEPRRHGEHGENQERDDRCMHRVATVIRFSPCLRVSVVNARMLEVKDLHAYYGKSHILHGVHMNVRAGRDRESARAQRRRALDHDQGHHGPGGDDRFGRVQAARQLARSEDLRGRAQRPGLRAGEPRHLSHAHRAAEPAARHEGSRIRRGAGASTTCTTLFPVLRERADAPAGVMSGGEQQMLTLVPYADGRSRAGDDRRADRGPGAEDRRAGRAAVRGNPEPRRVDPAGRAKAHHRA